MSVFCIKTGITAEQNGGSIDNVWEKLLKKCEKINRNFDIWKKPSVGLNKYSEGRCKECLKWKRR